MSEEKNPPNEPPPGSCLLRPQINWVKISNIGLLLLALFYTLYFARAIFLPLALALILALVFRPVQRALQRMRVPSVLAALLIVAAFCGIIILSFVPVIKPAVGWMEKMPQNARMIRAKFDKFRQPVEKVQQAAEQVKEASGVGATTAPNTTTVKVEGPGLEESLLEKSQTFGATISLSLAFLFFFLAFGDALSGAFAPQGGTLFIVSQISDSISSYLATVTVINIGLGVCVGIAMYLLGLPNPALWGLLAALANYIPYLGAIIGELVVFLVAMMTFDDVWRIVLPPLVYFLLNTAENTFVTPLVLGKRFTINPIVIFSAMVVWGWMWGIIGAIIAIPLLMGFKIFCDHFQPLYRLGEFMSLEKPIHKIKDDIIAATASEE